MCPYSKQPTARVSRPVPNEMGALLPKGALGPGVGDNSHKNQTPAVGGDFWVIILVQNYLLKGQERPTPDSIAQAQLSELENKVWFIWFTDAAADLPTFIHGFYSGAQVTQTEEHKFRILC